MLYPKPCYNESCYKEAVVYLAIFAAKNVSSFAMEKLLIFFQKNINVFAIFQDRNFNVMLANNFMKF